MSDTRVSNLSSLKRRLAGLFAIVAAVVIAGGLAYDHRYRASLRSDAEKLLLSIQSFKLTQLQDWRHDRLESTMSLLDSPILSVSLKRFAEEPSDKATAALLKARLEAFLKHNPYQAVMLVRADGKILISAGMKPQIIYPAAMALIPKAALSDRPEMGELYLAPNDKNPHIDIAARAAKASGGRSIFLLLRIAPKDYLYPLLKNWPTNSRSGETQLVALEGDKIVFLNELRHLSGAAMKLQLPVNTPERAATMAFKGSSGIVRGRDYRGAEVLAAVNTIPGTNWAIVTKMDMEEVLEGSGRVATLLILLALALLAAAGAGASILFRRQAEEYSRSYAALDKRAAKLKANYERITSQANDAILIADADTMQVLEANRKSHEIYGYSEAEFSRLKISDLVPEAGREAQKGRLERVRESSGVLLETGQRRKNGELFPAEISSAYISDEGKNYIFSIIRDLSERKRMEEALLQSNTLMKNTQDLAKIGGWEWNLNTHIMHWTDETFRIHDFEPDSFDPSAEEYIARSRLCYRPEDRPTVMAAFDRCVETGEPYDLEFPFTSAKGRRLWVRTTGRAERKGEKIVKISGTLSDITTSKLAALEAEKLNRDLADKKQEMENFLYITTHDLRSPLVNIQGFSQNLQRYIGELKETLARADLPPEARARVEKLSGDRIPGALKFILDSSQKMDSLITALLKVSRIGRVEMKPEALAMDELLKKIQDSLRYQLEDAGGKILWGALPPCKADPGAASQLFTNLLDNAIKYRKKDRALVLTIAGEVKGDMAVYTVKDNGSGIPATELHRIWNVFYQPERAPGRKGEGIGLPMVRRIVEKNGGAIRAESKEGEGSVFYVELPAAVRGKNEERG